MLLDDDHDGILWQVLLCMSSRSDQDIHNINLFLTAEEVTEVQRLALSMMFIANRVSHSSRCLGMTMKALFVDTATSSLLCIFALCCFFHIL